MKLIMLGAPGAGKGTQAVRLSDALHIPHISTGDIFRENIREKTELGKQVTQYLDNGLLVPDELTVSLLLDRIHREDCKDGFILDGFPRTIPQAEKLTEALEAEGQKVDAAVDVDVPDEVILDRMSGRRVCPSCGASYHIRNLRPKVEGICDRCHAELIQRPDDNAETVSKRLQVYHEQTEPLLQYYTKMGCLMTVDGTKPLDEVFHEILARLGVK